MEDEFRVLVVEDDRVSSTLLEKTLSRAGYNVTAVENGLKALELFAKGFYPIMLTDWVMPEMGGPELCQRIRESVTDGYVYIILLTARDSKEDIVAGLKAGADDYLTKPFHPAELIARLNTGKRIVSLERSLKKANEEIRLLSITDPLTGSYNRTYLTDRLPKELQRAIRYGHALSLILCDIDHFKKVNDTYGHLAGDEVLRVFAGRLRSSTRKDVDWVARFGGEEFLIVLPETLLDRATAVAERLRKGVSSYPVKISSGQDLHISASFGVAGFQPGIDQGEVTQEKLLGQADQLLYKAKEQGRNRVIGMRL
jgi:diguanylate cyclase (GGDEF)-like protein